MSAITHSFARYIALSVVSAGVIGGAALGLAGAANAATGSSNTPEPRPGIVATPHPVTPPLERFDSRRTHRLHVQKDAGRCKRIVTKSLSRGPPQPRRGGPYPLLCFQAATSRGSPERDVVAVV
jgi:hypothetical protein